MDALAFAPEGQPHAGDRYVFGNDVGERIDRIQTAWENACKAAGVTGLHFHDLQREFGSRLLDAGVPLTTIQVYLGHLGHDDRQVPRGRPAARGDGSRCGGASVRQ